MRGIVGLRFGVLTMTGGCGVFSRHAVAAAVELEVPDEQAGPGSEGSLIVDGFDFRRVDNREIGNAGAGTGTDGGEILDWDRDRERWRRRRIW